MGPPPPLRMSASAPRPHQADRADPAFAGISEEQNAALLSAAAFAVSSQGRMRLVLLPKVPTDVLPLPPRRLRTACRAPRPQESAFLLVMLFKVP